MGTSAARRAPTTRLWRLAKGAATRYLSPEGAGAVTAGEVAARYLAALGEGEQGPLAAFRLTRKVAQELGTLAAVAAFRGWQEALGSWGLGELAGHPPEVQAQGVGSALVGAGGGLEEAVARASLIQILRKQAGVDPQATAGQMAPEQLVPRFLAAALHLRLALDLGEPLEAAGSNYSHIMGGLDDLQGWIEQAAGAPDHQAPDNAEAWQGLAGWTWVTGVLAAMLSRLTDKFLSK
jgi:hypothetical protein